MKGGRKVFTVPRLSLRAMVGTWEGATKSDVLSRGFGSRELIDINYFPFQIKQ